MCPELTQPLTEMGTRNISWGWRRPVCRADNPTTFMCRLSWNLGASPSWNPQGLSRPVMGLFYLYLLLGHTTLGRTPLDEWSARIRDIYLTTHNTHNRQTFMPPAGFETAISVGERSEILALDRAATGIGILFKYVGKITFASDYGIFFFVSVCWWNCLLPYAMEHGNARHSTYRSVSIGFLFLRRCDPMRVMASSFLKFLDHTQRRTTVDRTPLNEWSVRRRDLYLTIHNTHNRQIFMPPLGFEPTISTGEQPQTYALERAATVTGSINRLQKPKNIYKTRIYEGSIFRRGVVYGLLSCEMLCSVNWCLDTRVSGQYICQNFNV